MTQRSLLDRLRTTM